MTSILTNASSMVALQTLKSINNNLNQVQSEISTGKSISSAKDNAAIWAISKVMESDVKGFQAISDSLSLGESSVAVALDASETVTDLLTDMKTKIVAAQEENVDRGKIQTDIDQLTNQIKSVVGAAQFNGLNLTKGTEDVKVLSSLDRSSDGTVAASDITVARQDMTTAAGVYGSGTSLAANGSVSAATVSATATYQDITLTHDASGVYTFTVNGDQVQVNAGADLAGSTDNVVAAINALGLEGISASNESNVVRISSERAFETVAVTAAASGGSAAVSAATATIAQRAETVTFSASANVNDGDSYRVTYDGNNYDYIAGKGETMEDVARGLKTALDGAGLADLSTKVTQNTTTGAWELHADNSNASDVTDFAITGAQDGEASGGMFGLDNIDVTTDTGVDNALDSIETLIQNSINAAAAFGSAQGRLETQSEFISNLTDSLKAGIGSMVDADMEEASAKLQALQVQQQLGIQALSIANQSPQSVLSLFQ